VVADDPLLQLTGDFTVEDWVRPEDGAPAVPGFQYIMAGKSDFDGGDYGIGMTGANSDDRLLSTRRALDGAWGQVLVPYCQPFRTSWFIAAVRLGNALAVYVSGALNANYDYLRGLP
jgi:hypothetical protein